MRIISIEIDGDDIVFMEETEHENLFHLIKIKKIYVEQLLDKLGYVKEETGMSKEMTAKEDIKKALDGLAQFIIMNDNGTDESASAIEWHNTLTEALTRAKKEHEMLELYRECNKEGVFWLEIQQRIAQLEKELEELK